jgi:hypothetical protein
MQCLTAACYLKPNGDYWETAAPFFDSLPEVPSSSRFLCGIKGLGRKAPAITEDQHNKTLQLSPSRSAGSVHTVLNSMQCWADAAAQLSSMLYSIFRN